MKAGVTTKSIEDYKLSRYACYLIVQNGNPNNEEILYYMRSEELDDNLFSIVQTEAKLKNDKVNNEYDANDTHYEVGIAIRDTINKLCGTMPKDLPILEKLIDKLNLEKLKELQNQ